MINHVLSKALDGYMLHPEGKSIYNHYHGNVIEEYFKMVQPEFIGWHRIITIPILVRLIRYGCNDYPRIISPWPLSHQDNLWAVQRSVWSQSERFARPAHHSVRPNFMRILQPPSNNCPLVTNNLRYLVGFGVHQGRSIVVL